MATASQRHPDDNTLIYTHGYAGHLLDAVSIAEAALGGAHTAPANRRSTVAYLIREGTLRVTAGNHTFTANPGDVITVPAGHERHLHGTVRYFIVTTPPFDPQDES